MLALNSHGTNMEMSADNIVAVNNTVDIARWERVNVDFDKNAMSMS